MGDQVITVDDIIRSQRDSILRGRRGTVLTGAAAQRFYERVARVYGVGRSAIPLGTAISLADVTEPEVTGLPKVVSGSTGISTGPIYGVPRARSRESTTQDQALLPTQPIKTRQAMDLGNIITTLGSAYLTARYGQPTTIPSQRPIMAQPVGLPSPGDVYGISPTPAFLPQVAAGAARLLGPFGFQMGSSASKVASAVAGLGLGLAADEIAAIAGAASKVKCRRRRRRLATHSDIKDLAALKAVLGSGKAFDTWIATRRV